MANRKKRPCKRLSNKGRLKHVQLCLAFLTFASFAGGTSAAPVDIFQLSVFLNAPSLGVQSLEDTRIGSGLSEFAPAGLDVTFSNSLNADNFGTVSWLVTNNTGGDLIGADFFGFLDAEIDEPGNSFFNEFGSLVSVTGAGASDPAPDTWEIDEPGFLFGDIFSNLQGGFLDEINGVPSGMEDDVSLALGFEIGDVLAGASIVATFEISSVNIGGLSHTDPDSAVTIFFNGSARVLAISEPDTFVLVSAAMLLLGGFSRSIHGRQAR